jgi:hypothetical protein
MYEDIEGVPRRTTSDNPKVFALKADKYEPLLNPAFERFADYYGTIVECLPPRDPEKKGKVERPIPYIRRLLESYAGDRNDINAVQAYLTQKLAVANERKHGTTRERPIDRLCKEERATLKPLPILPFEKEQYHEGLVRIDGHVRFQGKYYSVEEQYIRQQVTVIGNARQIAIYQDGKLIETHERVTDRTRSKSTKRHHLKPWERICDNPEGLKALAEKIGPFVHDVVDHILRKGDGFVDLRRIWGILSFDKKYSKNEIDAACEHALWSDEISYHSIKRFILEAQEQCPENERSAVLPPGKFQRSLSEYTQLLLKLEKGDVYEH